MTTYRTFGGGTVTVTRYHDHADIQVRNAQRETIASVRMEAAKAERLARSMRRRSYAA